MILKEVDPSTTYVLTGTGHLTELKGDQTLCAEELFREEIQRAFCQGREEGERQGYAKASEETHHLSALLHTLADHLVEQRKRLLAGLKPEIVELSFQIAETLIRHELSQPKQFLALIGALLNQAITTFAGSPLKLFLAPEDLAALEKHLESLNECPLQIHSDPKLRCGDCRIESEMGVLNAEIGRELNHLKAKLI